MSQLPPISKAELEVAQALWSLGEASARQVMEQLPPHRQLDFSTVQTYLSRLEAKGYLTSKLVGRAKFYRGCVQTQQVVRDAVNDFVQRLFGGEPLPLVRHLISENKVSEAQLTELRALLRELEEKHGDAKLE